MMNFVETMLKGIVQKVCTSTVVAYGDYQLDFSKPFERLTMHDAVVKYAACSAADLAPENIDALLKSTVSNTNQQQAGELSSMPYLKSLLKVS